MDEKAVENFLIKKQEEFQEQLRTAKNQYCQELQRPSFVTKTHPADLENDPETLSIIESRIKNLEKCRKKCDEARERLKKGNYGTCSLCGEPIPPARLQLVPFTDYCTPCKKWLNGEE